MATISFTVAGVSNKVPVLGADGKVEKTELATYLPQSAREWYDMTSSRVRGTWYTNTSGNEMVVHCISDNINDGSYFNFQVRKNASSSILTLTNASMNGSSGGVPYRVAGYLTVPIGWQYQLVSANINTRTILGWHELR